METTESTNDVSINQPRPNGHIALGVLLLLPALLCCISQLLVPTVNTFQMSFQKIRLLGSENMFVGMENYSYLFGDDGFRQAAGFTVTTIMVRLFIVALVPLLLAWAVSHVGRPLRLGMRVLLTLPLVLFLPAAIAVTWLLFLNPANGWFAGNGSWFASPERARTTLLFIDALYFFGLACGVGLIVFLPLWRRPADTPRPATENVWKTMLTLWMVGLLAVIAMTLSTLGLSYVMTNGGPAGSTSNLGMLIYQFGFRNFNMGPAAAVASLLLLITMLLGTIAGILLIVTRLRLDVVETRKPSDSNTQANTSPRNRSLAGLLLIALGLLTVGTCLLSALPFGSLLPQAFGENGIGRLLEEVSPGRILINSLVPPLIAATLQVLVAYLAALGIGALRPLGKHSEWLLLLFSPWFFISVLPLSLASYMSRQEAGSLDTLMGSVSPILFSVPALFILTLFFAGRTSARNTIGSDAVAAPDFTQKFILPSLPLAGVIWLALLFVHGADFFWPLLVNISPERYNLNLTLLQIVGRFGGADALLATLVTLFVLPATVFFFVCLVPFQTFYLDRLTVYAENPSLPKVDHNLE